MHMNHLDENQTSLIRTERSITALPPLQQPLATLLPEPRIWKPKQLADFFGVSIHWVYKRTASEAEDPIPRIPGVGRLSFDTQSPSFQAWMDRQLGYAIDTGHDYE